MLPLPGIKPWFLSHPACGLTTTSPTLAHYPSSSYNVQMTGIQQERKSLHFKICSLHRCLACTNTKINLWSSFFFFTTAGFDVGTLGGTTNIQPLSICSEACCGLQQSQQYWNMHSTAEDCFFWPDTQGSLHNPTGTKAKGSVTKEGRQVALLCWTTCKALCN